MKKILTLLLLLPVLAFSQECPETGALGGFISRGCTSINGTPSLVISFNYQPLAGSCLDVPLTLDYQEVNNNGNPIGNSLVMALTICVGSSAVYSVPLGAGNCSNGLGNDFILTFGELSCPYDADGVLPVELVSFSAKADQDKNQVVLEWGTVTESSNKGFYVKRSADGYTWEEIAFIEGSGTTLEPKKYNYTDSRPFQGLSYYRLKQEDFDGTAEEFSIVSVNFSADPNELKIYPNPSKGSVVVSGATENVSLFDAQGRLLRSYQGLSNGLINLEGLPAGVILVRVEMKNGRIQNKRLILN